MHLRLFLLAFLTPALAAQTATQAATQAATQTATQTGTLNPLCDRIATLTQDPSAASAHWGVMVTTLDGAELCGINQAQLFRPASNNKIFTTTAALTLLGPQATVETKVLGIFDPATGVVTGDLTLLGGGDANLDSNDLPYLSPSQRPKIPRPQAFHDLEDLAAQLVAKGVKSITGDIVGDDTLFPYEPYAPSWNADDFTWGYGAPVSALTIADNQLKLTITPAAPNAPATVILDQNGVAYYTIQNEVRTVAAKARDGVQVERLPGSRTIRIFGTIASDSAPDTEELAIDDPAAYAAMAFRNLLATHAIAIAGVARAQHRPVIDGASFTSALLAHGQEDISAKATGSCPSPDKAPTLAAHLSAPLADDILLTNKVSQNLHAELLLHRLGLATACSGSNVAGARTIRAFATHAGVDPRDFILYDGSGLSDHDLLTPRALTKILSYAAAQPWFATFQSSLPSAGADGTLAARFKPPLPFTLAAKTGTLGETRALSGYLTTTTGRQLIFSILVDTHLPTTAADRTIMDKIVNTIASEN